MYYNLFWCAFCKLALISSKISIEDAPGCFRIFTLMFSSLFMLLSWIPFNMESPMISICDFFSGLALPTWLFDFSLLWLFDFTNLPFSLIVATCSFESESLILWVLLDALLVELWPIEILFVFSSQLFWMISLCIILSFDFNSELVRSAIVVRNLFMIWSFDFGSSCSWSIILLIYYFDLLFWSIILSFKVHKFGVKYFYNIFAKIL